jgi:uncharacterized damage-inducible protein DinB
MQGQVLLQRMDEVWERGGWTVPLGKAISGLSASQAAWRPGDDANSIWQIVRHLSFWKEIAVRNLRGLPRLPGPIVNRETFGLPGEPADQSGWQAEEERLRGLQRQLREAVANLRDEALARPLPGERLPLGEVLHGMAEHDAYHSGQIILIRRLQGAWEGES